jgi:hypothetical protein
MEPRILATFEDRNRLSLIFLVCLKYFLRINQALFRDNVKSFRLYFLPYGRNLQNIEPERFNRVNSA